MDPNAKIPITHKATFHNYHQLHHIPQPDHDQTDLNTKILVRQPLILFADVPLAKANLHPMSLRAETGMINDYCNACWNMDNSNYSDESSLSSDMIIGPESEPIIGNACH